MFAFVLGLSARHFYSVTIVFLVAVLRVRLQLMGINTAATAAKIPPQEAKGKFMQASTINCDFGISNAGMGAEWAAKMMVPQKRLHSFCWRLFFLTLLSSLPVSR